MAERVSTLKAAVMISSARASAEITPLLQTVGYDAVNLGSSALRNNYKNLHLIIADYNFVHHYGSELSHIQLPKLALMTGGIFPDERFSETGFHAFINYPLKDNNFDYALKTALYSYERERRIIRQVEDLTFKISCRKFIVMAEMKIIYWLQCEEKTAYDVLQRTAMQHRMSIEELSIDLLSNAEHWCHRIKITREKMPRCHA